MGDDTVAKLPSVSLFFRIATGRIRSGILSSLLYMLWCVNSSEREGIGKTHTFWSCQSRSRGHGCGNWRRRGCKESTQVPVALGLPPALTWDGGVERGRRGGCCGTSCRLLHSSWIRSRVCLVGLWRPQVNLVTIAARPPPLYCAQRDGGPPTSLGWTPPIRAREKTDSEPLGPRAGEGDHPNNLPFDLTLYFFAEGINTGTRQL